MESLWIKIGDHIIQIDSHSERMIQFFKKLYQVIMPASTASVDIWIKVEEGYGVPFVDYNVDIKNEKELITYRRADYLIEMAPDFKAASVFVYDEFALKHAFINLYSSYIVHIRWGLLIHSSCVVEKEQAHLFAGPSGAGKSTVAKLSYPRQLLSDEATLIKITDGEIIVYDSPFRSDIEEKGLAECRPLASIQILHQAIENDRILMKKSDGLFQIMDKIFYWTHCPEDTKKILPLMKTLVDRVPLYELHFQKNNSFWELIS
ncbi:hypothetical protein [Caldalkalibacillus mannanilyticus]|uniref:hypothetical protein n=1 Tax=Caldalkalibacillus mannanilyticus TaxID=1418 RepID=UPI0004692878|nr:hypothetical protein [Caldalkalibacillus mannanilyticus]